MGLYKKERDDEELKLRKETQEVLKKANSENGKTKKNSLLAEFTKSKIIEIQKLEDEWINRIESATIENKTSKSYQNYWVKRNKWNKLVI